MSNASIDQNGVRSLLGVLDTDGATVVPVLADPTTHHLKSRAGTSGSDLGPINAPRDGNSVPALMCVSNIDGVTPVVIYANSAGQILVEK